MIDTNTEESSSLNIEEAELAAEVSPPATAPTSRSNKVTVEERRRLMLVAEGMSEEKAAELAKRLMGRKPQRRLPSTDALSPERIAHFEGRSDEQIELAAVQSIHLDGGPPGVIRAYERAMADATNDTERAERMRDLMAERMASIRTTVVAVINEQRRRRAVRDGVDPRSVKFIRVNP